MLELKYGLKFEDLYNHGGLSEIDNKFLCELAKQNSDLYHQLMLGRTHSVAYASDSKLIIELAKFLEDFISNLFGIEEFVGKSKAHHKSLETLLQCRRLFIQRKVAKQLKISTDEVLAKIDEAKKVLGKFVDDFEDEIQFAKKVMDWQAQDDKENLLHAVIYASWALFTEEGKKKHKKGVLFHIPKKISNDCLIELKINDVTGAKESQDEFKNREGFSLNDDGMRLDKAMANAHYCIYCHNQKKDSCSHGIRDKETGNIATNSLGIKQDGCPLDEKISEMNYLKSINFVIAPLAVAIIDNPMIAATGHRICNDCMRSCIYQKQEPVDIPFVETQTLNDVLKLPWGFEIYSLLTRWNPLNFSDYLPKQVGSYKSLVVGLGPAGFTLAHYLLNQGINVVAVDGLKIEPLDSNISGIELSGERHEFKPIKNVYELYEDLDKRASAGFGGVAEYGITVRWNKNYLKIIRLLLERRSHFRMYGSVRFGSGLTYDKAQELDFDHISLAIGAGKPNLPDIGNILAKGVRTASDFLMSLQLSGASRKDSLSNLQIELPIVVIGGGLTAIDAATESLNYYGTQVEKFLENYELLGEAIFDNLDSEEILLARKFINHGRELKNNPNKRTHLLRRWGGVTIAYRKDINNSPGYRLNHEEVSKAFEEGIQFLENITPTKISIDENGHCVALEYKGGKISARSIIIAAGTVPNVTAAKEYPDKFTLENKYFRLSKKEGVLLSNTNISCFGDAHPLYAGNVVKAMASAKHGYKEVVDFMQKKDPKSNTSGKEFFAKLNQLFLATVQDVKILTPNIVEIIIKAPLASQSFLPGQFYRFQNYEKNSLKMNGKILAIEGLALTGASVDTKSGLLSLIVLEIGTSSKLCRYLKKGEVISLMGPTGTPTEIPKKEKVMLVGGGLGNAVLFSIGKALKANGCEILYFAGYKKAADRYKQKEIEKAADVIAWCCDEEVLSKSRECDFSFHANIVESIKIYGEKNIGKISLFSIDRIIAIGSDSMMAAVVGAKEEKLKHLFKKGVIGIASINSPMQCMMKEICAQCLQKHTDHKTGKEYYIYSCYNQDQNMYTVDFSFLKRRLRQNSLLEKSSTLFANSKLFNL